MTTDAAQEAENEGASPLALALDESCELVEKEIRDRFKKMCEGYFDNVSKKLVKEHTVRSFLHKPLYFSSHTLNSTLPPIQKLQEQDRRNHEAYIRSGEIFEDRQQAYEKMTKGYEKLLASCQTYAYFLDIDFII